MYHISAGKHDRSLQRCFSKNCQHPPVRTRIRVSQTYPGHSVPHQSFSANCSGTSATLRFSGASFTGLPAGPLLAESLRSKDRAINKSRLPRPGKTKTSTESTPSRFCARGSGLPWRTLPSPHVGPHRKQADRGSLSAENVSASTTASAPFASSRSSLVPAPYSPPALPIFLRLRANGSSQTPLALFANPR